MEVEGLGRGWVCWAKVLFPLFSFFFFFYVYVEVYKDKEDH